MVGAKAFVTEVWTLVVELELELELEVVSDSEEFNSSLSVDGMKGPSVLGGNLSQSLRSIQPGATVKPNMPPVLFALFPANVGISPM